MSSNNAKQQSRRSSTSRERDEVMARVERSRLEVQRLKSEFELLVNENKKAENLVKACSKGGLTKYEEIDNIPLKAEKKTKGYNVEEAREFMKKKKEQLRLEKVKLEDEKKKAIEERKSKLKELDRKRLALIEKSKRGNSKSPKKVQVLKGDITQPVSPKILDKAFIEYVPEDVPKSISKNVMNKNEAACKIQAYYRGFAARKQYEIHKRISKIKLAAQQHEPQTKCSVKENKNLPEWLQVGPQKEPFNFMGAVKRKLVFNDNVHSEHKVPENSDKSEIKKAQNGLIQLIRKEENNESDTSRNISDIPSEYIFKKPLNLITENLKNLKLQANNNKVESNESVIFYNKDFNTTDEKLASFRQYMKELGSSATKKEKPEELVVPDVQLMPTEKVLESKIEHSNDDHVLSLLKSVSEKLSEVKSGGSDMKSEIPSSHIEEISVKENVSEEDELVDSSKPAITKPDKDSSKTSIKQDISSVKSDSSSKSLLVKNGSGTSSPKSSIKTQTALSQKTQISKTPDLYSEASFYSYKSQDFIEPLEVPKVALKSSVEELDSNKENVVNLKPGERTSIETIGNQNQIHVTFEAELHLLNDFNKSLFDMMKVEKSLVELEKKTADTQTSLLDNSLLNINATRDTELLSENSILCDLDETLMKYSIAKEVRERDQQSAQSFVKLFDQLVNEEDVRLENLKVQLKRRERLLLQRTERELSWLEKQKRRLLESGKTQEASLLRKKQRGILIKHQQEKHEMQKLKQMEKQHSEERKMKLREQQNLIKSQLGNYSDVMKIKRTPSKRRSEPLKVLTILETETSVSHKSSDNEGGVNSIRLSQKCSSIHVTDNNNVNGSISSGVDLKNIQKALLMRETELQARRRKVEELLVWYQNLVEEERKVAELEAAASNVVVNWRKNNHHNNNKSAECEVIKTLVEQVKSGEKPKTTMHEIKSNISNITSELSKLWKSKEMSATSDGIESIHSEKSVLPVIPDSIKAKSISEYSSAKDEDVKEDDETSSKISDIQTDSHFNGIKTESSIKIDSHIVSDEISTTTFVNQDTDKSSKHMKSIENTPKETINGIHSDKSVEELSEIEISVKPTVQSTQSIASNQKKDSNLTVHSVHIPAEKELDKHSDKTDLTINDISSEDTEEKSSVIEEEMHNGEMKVSKLSASETSSVSSNKITDKPILSQERQDSVSEASSKSIEDIDEDISSLNIKIKSVNNEDKTSIRQDKQCSVTKVSAESVKTVEDIASQNTADKSSVSQEIQEATTNLKTSTETFTSTENTEELSSERREDKTLSDKDIKSENEVVSKNSDGSLSEESTSIKSIEQSSSHSENKSSQDAEINKSEISINGDQPSTEVEATESDVSEDNHSLKNTSAQSIEEPNSIVKSSTIKSDESQQDEDKTNSDTVQTSKILSEHSNQFENDFLSIAEQRESEFSMKSYAENNAFLNEENHSEGNIVISNQNSESITKENTENSSVIISKNNTESVKLNETDAKPLICEIEERLQQLDLSDDASKLSPQKEISIVSTQLDENYEANNSSKLTHLPDVEDEDTSSTNISELTIDKSISDNLKLVREKVRSAIEEHVMVGFDDTMRSLYINSTVLADEINKKVCRHVETELLKVMNIEEILDLIKQEVTEGIEKFVNGSFILDESMPEGLNATYTKDSYREPTVEFNEDDSEEDSMSNIIDEHTQSDVSYEEIDGFKEVDVKKRVNQILEESRSTYESSKSPRMQDLYTTAFDVVSDEADFSSEAEELLKKQLAIEQEIKQLEQQQKQQYLYMREIPNKPPPPYKPPKIFSAPKVPSIIPSPEQIDLVIEPFANLIYEAYIEKSLQNLVLPANLTFRIIESDCVEFMFDLCKELAIKHYKEFDDEENHKPPWMQIPKKVCFRKPCDIKGLRDMFEHGLKQQFEPKSVSSETQKVSIKWSRIKRDHVDKLLMAESQAIESEWTNYELDEAIVKDKVTNDILNKLLDDEIVNLILLLKKKQKM